MMRPIGYSEFVSKQGVIVDMAYYSVYQTNQVELEFQKKWMATKPTEERHRCVQYIVHRVVMQIFGSSHGQYIYRHAPGGKNQRRFNNGNCYGQT
jgi:hypothetical protein